jgi:hypothetical protein
MDAATANKKRAATMAKGNQHALIHKARSRKKSGGAFTAPIRLSKLPKTTGGIEGAMAHHLDGLHPKAGFNFAVICFTHGTATLCRTRHAATFGAVFTSARDGRTPKQIAQSGKDCPVKWCAGCVSAVAASV